MCLVEYSILLMLITYSVKEFNRLRDVVPPECSCHLKVSTFEYGRSSQYNLRDYLCLIDQALTGQHSRSRKRQNIKSSRSDRLYIIARKNSAHFTSDIIGSAPAPAVMETALPISKWKRRVETN